MQKKRIHLLEQCLLVIALCLGLTAQAADRALLVGVGQFRDNSLNLEGIDIDLDTMREMASLMGFIQITVLQDEQATYANTRAALAGLIEQTGDGDRALFYFSGHGAQVTDENGDEPDSLDEILVMHNTQVIDGKVDNILIDDEIGQLLSHRRGGELYMIVDACHSGTSSKSARMVKTEATTFFNAQTAQKKGLGFIGATAKAPAAVAQDAKQIPRFVSLAAARDDQQSLATKAGSMFTLGLREALVEARATGGITFSALRDKTAAFIAQNTTDQDRFNPELQGNQELFGKAMALKNVGQHGGMWARFVALVNQSSDKRMKLQTDKGSRVQLGDYFTLTVDLPMAGYLSVIAVDSGSENPVVLFPNAWMGETRFDAGRVILPPAAHASWGLRADEPSKTLIVAVVTPTPLNLYGDGVRKDRVDLGEKVFARLAPGGPSQIEKSTRAPGAVAKTVASQTEVDFGQ